MNQLESSEIEFIFENGELIDIYYFQKPSGEYIGARMLKGEYPKLKDFKYRQTELGEVAKELGPILHFEKKPWFLKSGFTTK